VQTDLQLFIDGLAKYPAPRAPDEYAAPFERSASLDAACVHAAMAAAVLEISR
jgi:hypothetical protein